MGAQGSTTVNFGSFPGASDTSTTITGQGSIGSGSLLEAWVLPIATADHSVDEHIVDPPMATAGNIVAGTGFTLYAAARDGIPVPDAVPVFTGQGTNAQVFNQEHGRKAPMPYGLWTVGWAWN